MKKKSKQSEVRQLAQKLLTAIVLLLMVSLLGATVNAQNVTVTGSVIDTSGEPVPGTTVVVKGTTQGTVTDSDGNYSISNVPSDAILQFSFIGMKTQEILVTDKTSINITMTEETFRLEEVVAIGYGTVKKSDLTGAVSSVNPEKIEKSTASSIGDMLAGRAPGLNIFKNSAQPGGNVSFLIRGAASTVSNDPLIVVDGFPLSDVGEPGSGNRYNSGSKDWLTTINPDDIASIEILKDASSTAIYGARAANGVILITTKRGKEGLKVTYDGSYSVQKFAERWDMLNASEYLFETNHYNIEYAKLSQEITPYGNNPISDFVKPSNLYSESEINAAGEGSDFLGNALRTGMVQKHNISLSGGNGNTNYLASVNMFEDEGIVKGNSLNKISGRVNFDQKIGNYLKTGFSASFTRENHDNVPLGEGQNENAGVLRAAIEYNPNIIMQNEDGVYPIDPNHSFVPNPASLFEIEDETTRDRLLAMAYLEIFPIKELKFRFNVGSDIFDARRNTYLPKLTLYGERENGKASIALSEKDVYLFDATVNYSKIFNQKHNLTWMAGYSYQEFRTGGFNAENHDFLIDDFLWYNMGSGAAEKPTVGSYGGKESIASYFGRINYIFDSKYILTTTIRADGASNFASNKKWGYFPSIQLGWVITNEPFMQDNKDILSNLKVRMTYGETGNNSIGNNSLAAYRTGTNFYFNKMQATGVYAYQLENPNLSWETSTEFNLGLDFGILENKVKGAIDIYQRTVSDLLFHKSILSYHEVNRLAFNAGSTQSKGVEFNLNANVLNRVNFKWDADYNFSLYRDDWKERDPEWTPKIYDEVDGPMRPIYSYLSDGLVQLGENIPHMQGAMPGIIKLKDIDGFLRDEEGNPVVDENGRFQYLGEPDGRLDDADRVLLGRQEPGNMMSLSNTFSYKNFDLNIYFYGYFNRYKIDRTREYYEGGAFRIAGGTNLFKTIQDVWTPENQESDIPGLFQGLSSWGTGDYYYENASFIRLQHITLGYNIPSALFKDLRISQARIYFNAQNLFVFTPYGGLDPETDSMAGYPNQRTYTVGVSVSF